MTWRTRARPPGRPSTEDESLAAAGAAVSSTATFSTHSSSPTYSVARRRNSSLTGHAGVVSCRVKETAPVSGVRRFLTKPHATMSAPRSGSWMRARAARTAASRSSG